MFVFKVDISFIFVLINEKHIKVSIENIHINSLYVKTVEVYKKVDIQLMGVIENKILVDINTDKKDNFIDEMEDELDNCYNIDLV